MYATCLHCQRSLGRNQLLETLPVGRRIAFDEAAGRLWVVCPSCARWNLVPFDARYEAIEAGEKLFRETRLRMSTGQIGLAKTREGTELIRIGAPQRPEMAAWRYAGSLLKRRMRFAVRVAPVTIGLAGLAKLFGPAWMLAGGGPGISLLGISAVSGLAVRRMQERTLATVELHGYALDLTREVVRSIRLDATTPESMRVLLPVLDTRRIDTNPYSWLSGDREWRTVVDGVLAKDDEHADSLQTWLVAGGGHLSQVLRVIMPIANEAGASQPTITNAVQLLSHYDADPRQLLFGRRKDWSVVKRATLVDVNEPRRLALEMSLHEESERRWLAGELHALEAEWRRAEEIATIADGLVASPGVEARLQELRERS